MSTNEEREFYLSQPWLKLRRMKLNQDPLCECCIQYGRTEIAVIVHHMLPVLQYPNEKLNMKFLMSLCSPCHQTMEAEQRQIEREKLDEEIRRATGNP